MMVKRLPVTLCLLLLIAAQDAFGQDEFDLSQAFGEDEKKPTEKPQPAQPGIDGGDTAGKKPTEKPMPAQPGQGGGGAGGTFGDDDLADAAGGVPHHDPNGRDSKPHAGSEEGEQGKENQSVIAGVLSALGVAAVGAISSFIAYQKKKLCFKGQTDPENVNMDSHKGDQNDPQAQSNLLAK